MSRHLYDARPVLAVAKFSNELLLRTYHFYLDCLVDKTTELSDCIDHAPARAIRNRRGWVGYYSHLCDQLAAEIHRRHLDGYDR